MRLRAASAAVEMRQALRKAAEMPTSVGPLQAVHVGWLAFRRRALFPGRFDAS